MIKVVRAQTCAQINLRLFHPAPCCWVPSNYHFARSLRSRRLRLLRPLRCAGRSVKPQPIGRLESAVIRTPTRRETEVKRGRSRPMKWALVGRGLLSQVPRPPSLRNRRAVPCGPRAAHGFVNLRDRPSLSTRIVGHQKVPTEPEMVPLERPPKRVTSGNGKVSSHGRHPPQVASALAIAKLFAKPVVRHFHCLQKRTSSVVLARRRHRCARLATHALGDSSTRSRRSLLCG